MDNQGLTGIRSDWSASYFQQWTDLIHLQVLQDLTKCSKHFQIPGHRKLRFMSSRVRLLPGQSVAKVSWCSEVIQRQRLSESGAYVEFWNRNR